MSSAPTVMLALLPLMAKMGRCESAQFHDQSPCSQASPPAATSARHAGSSGANGPTVMLRLRTAVMPAQSDADGRPPKPRLGKQLTHVEPSGFDPSDTL